MTVTGPTGQIVRFAGSPRYSTARNIAIAAGKLAYRKSRPYLMAKAVPIVQKMAASRIRRAWRRYQYYNKKPRGRKRKYAQFSRRHVGNVSGVSNSKVIEVANPGPISHDTRTIYLTDMTLIPRASFGARNQRERNVLFLTGCKIDMEVLNTTTSPMYFNVAIVSPRTTTIVSTQNFFRNNGNGSSRSTTFDTSLRGLDVHTYAINSDLYTVLMHKRFRLGPKNNEDDYAEANGRNYMNFTHWKRIGRQFRYNSNSDSNAEKPCFFIYWSDFFGAPGGTAQQIGAMQITKNMKTYFRETGNN